MQKAYPPSWFEERMASLKAMWNGLHPPQVSTQLVLEF
jgi:RNA-directed DNA polymerase